MQPELQHIRYPKISEDTARWSPDPRTAKWLQRTPWLVTEKIHGAHFSVITDGHQVRYAKRAEILRDDEAFFWHHQALRPLEQSLQALSQALLCDPDLGDGLDAIHIHGELFGGAYPHPEVAPVEGVQAVQTGVYYCPEVRFCVYDIGLFSHALDGLSFLAFEDVLALCEAHDLMTPPLLKTATWAEASAFKPVFQSALSQHLGLPSLPDNLAEGVVIRPPTEVLVQTDDGDWVRPILKIKHPKFAEDARYHQSLAPARPSGEVAPLTRLEWEAATRLNSNRLAAARSKQGPFCDPKTLAAEVTADIWLELCVQLPTLLAALSTEEQTLLRAVLEADAEAACAQSLQP